MLEKLFLVILKLITLAINNFYFFLAYIKVIKKPIKFKNEKYARIEI